MTNTSTRAYAVGAALAVVALAGPVHDARQPDTATVIAGVYAKASPLSCALSASALAGGLRERAFTAQSAKNFAVQTRQACDEVRQ